MQVAIRAKAIERNRVRVQILLTRVFSDSHQTSTDIFLYYQELKRVQASRPPSGFSGRRRLEHCALTGYDSGHEQDSSIDFAVFGTVGDSSRFHFWPDASPVNWNINPGRNGLHCSQTGDLGKSRGR
jgi:hypothetical protein